MSGQMRAYGGWRERRGYGLGSLNGAQTALGLAGVLMLVSAVLLLPTALPMIAVPLVVGVVVVLVRIRGESIAAILVRHTRWYAAQRGGATEYDGLNTPELPSVLGDLAVQEFEDHAVIWDQRRGTVSAMVPVEPLGVGFVDPHEVGEWVTAWGGWLAQLGYVPDLLHIQVTVHNAAEPSPVPQEVAEGLAGRVISELRLLAVASSAARTVVTATLRTGADPQRARARLQEVLSAVEGLNHCGVAVLRPMTVSDVSHWVRSCYDPVERHDGQAEWLDARPTATREHWNRYRHDSGWSAAFRWDECPGDHVSPEALERLLGPSDYVKRVCIVYEPIPAHEAAREVDRQTQAAAFRSQYRRRLGRDETARERLDRRRAEQTANEQAAGSGLVDVGLYAVVTSVQESELDLAVADLLNRAGESRIRLRRAYGAQGQYFAVSLGLGYVPAGRL